MIGSIFAGCLSAKAAMWTVTTVLQLTAIVVSLIQLKQE
jgi:hypothetical protein